MESVSMDAGYCKYWGTNLQHAVVEVRGLR